MSLVPSSRSNEIVTTLTGIVGNQIENYAKRKFREAFEGAVDTARDKWRRYATTGPSRYQGTSGATLGTILASGGLSRQDSGNIEDSGSNRVSNSNSRSMRNSNRSYGSRSRRVSSKSGKRKSRRSGKKKSRKSNKTRTVTRRYTGRVSGASQTRSSRYKKQKQKIVRGGYSLVQEYGGSVEDPYCVIFGHSTHAFNQLFRGLCGALVKMVLKKANLLYGNPNTINANLSVGDQIELRYRPESSDFAAAEAVVTASVSNTPIGSITPNTVHGLISLLTNNLGGALSVSADIEARKPQIKFTSVVWNPSGTTDSTRVFVNLMGAQVRYYSESGMTLQNVTANEATDAETTDVDALPLKGYTYEGSGSGTGTLIQTETLSAERLSFFANRNGYITGLPGDYGVPVPLSPLVKKLVNEPLDKKDLTHCRKSKPMMMQSGGIFIDNLSYYRSCPLDVFVQTMWNFYYSGTPSTTGAITKIRHPYGKYKLFMLEKVIEFAGLDVVPSANCKVRWEKNIDIGFQIIPKKMNTMIKDKFINERIPGVVTTDQPLN